MTPRAIQRSLSEKRNLRELERRRSNREAILHAAEAVIGRKGLTAASMDDVAAEAGFSKATLYKYVQGKSELILELMIHYMEDLDVRLRKIADRPLKPEAKLLALLREVIRYQSEKENISRAFILDSSSFRVIHAMAGDRDHPPTAADRDFRRRLLAVRRSVLDDTARFLREGIEAGAFRPFDVEAGVGFLSAVIQGYQHDRFARETKPDLEKNVSDIYAFVLRGLKAEKQADA